MYVGQSKNIRMRWNEHSTDLKINIHGNPYLQRVYNKYGKDAMLLDVVEFCDKELLNEREVFWIQKFDSFNTGINLTAGGDSMGGINRIPVLCITTGMVYPSIQEAARCTRTLPSSIWKVLHGKISQTCGLDWDYANRQRKTPYVSRSNVGSRRSVESRVKMSIAAKKADRSKRIPTEKSRTAARNNGKAQIGKPNLSCRRCVTGINLSNGYIIEFEYTQDAATYLIGRQLTKSKNSDVVRESIQEAARVYGSSCRYLGFQWIYPQNVIYYFGSINKQIETQLDAKPAPFIENTLKEIDRGRSYN